VSHCDLIKYLQNAVDDNAGLKALDAKVMFIADKYHRSSKVLC
jgi:hypothetical protein